MKIEFSFYDGHLKESNEFTVNLLGTLLHKYFKELYMYYIGDFVLLNIWSET